MLRESSGGICINFLSSVSAPQPCTSSCPYLPFSCLLPSSWAWQAGSVGVEEAKREGREEEETKRKRCTVRRAQGRAKNRKRTVLPFPRKCRKGLAEEQSRQFRPVEGFARDLLPWMPRTGTSSKLAEQRRSLGVRAGRKN